ncbi:MAG TPA: fructosamine kinase family protein [Solirubrobacteraceae bacterium]|nr:fructosamine kinase family protein [Solirubrobacteraceae bacterium]
MTLPAGATDPRRVGGGDLNEAWRVTLADGSTAFVKTRADARPGEYALEATQLAWLGEPGAVRVPAVLEVDDRYLVLEWVEPGRLDDAGAQELGRGLARIHAAGAPCFGNMGRASAGGSGGDGGVVGSGEAQAPATFGSLQLPNDPMADWASFYRERRLLPLAKLAHDRRALSPGALHALERVCERVEELAGPAEPPARLHGDLWAGNVHADARGHPWLIDPSAYGGHREIDLAMLRLFGTPSAHVFAAYEELTPLADGWEQRVQLWQLLPLLVHALLFGGSYGAAVEQIARHYGR